MNRRGFLKIGSMGMMAVALAGCGFSAPAGNISGQAAGSAGSRAGMDSGRMASVLLGVSARIRSENG